MIDYPIGSGVLTGLPMTRRSLRVEDERRHAGANHADSHEADAGFFHTSDGTAYADIHIHGHRETWPIRSDTFAHLVRRQIFEQKGSAATRTMLRQILDHYEAEAQFNGPRREMHLRVGQHNGRIYVDLADDEWRVVEVAPDGWRIVEQAPISFRRMRGMTALPIPQEGGSIEELRSLLNLQSRRDFVLVVAWLLAALRGIGPYPVLAIWGGRGSAKSMMTQILRELVDPNVGPIRPLPRSEYDLFVSADASLMQSYDNVSHLNSAMSDALCRLATGAAFATRRLYTNNDEVLLQANRPIILNGISDVITRADLVDRSLSFTLEPIIDDQRRTRAEVLKSFARARPKLFGALLDAVARGLRELPNTRPTVLTRMADFELWATACEPALWSAGSFQQAYAANRREAVENSVEADPVAATILKIAERGAWQGTADDLRRLLPQYADEELRKSDKEWPTTPRAVYAAS